MTTPDDDDDFLQRLKAPSAEDWAELEARQFAWEFFYGQDYKPYEEYEKLLRELRRWPVRG